VTCELALLRQQIGEAEEAEAEKKTKVEKKDD